jgi:hypothetical protein
MKCGQKMALKFSEDPRTGKCRKRMYLLSEKDFLGLFVLFVTIFISPEYFNGSKKIKQIF